MKTFDAIIVAGGLSSRMGFDKLSAFLGDQTVLSRTLAPFLTLPFIKNIIVATDRDYALPEGVIRVPAGQTRSRSVLSGLDKVTSPYVLIHDGARPFVTAHLIERLCAIAEEKGSAIPYLPATDTVRRFVGGKFDLCPRNEIFLLQTPQVFKTDKIKLAYTLGDCDETDDSTLYERYISPCHYIEGDFANKKITRPEDLFGANALIGTGFDIHPLVPGRELRLCGVTVPHTLGEKAHSDGDAPIHALMDAILTALSLPDIGHFFPDTDPAYKDIDSTLLLSKVMQEAAKQNRRVLSADIVILLEKPKISPYLGRMQARIAELLQIPVEKVGISATTTEKIGLIGQNQAIASLAIVSVL